MCGTPAGSDLPLVAAQPVRVREAGRHVVVAIAGPAAASPHTNHCHAPIQITASATPPYKSLPRPHARATNPARNAFHYIDCHKPNRTQPGHCTPEMHEREFVVTGEFEWASQLCHFHTCLSSIKEVVVTVNSEFLDSVLSGESRVPCMAEFAPSQRILVE